MKAYRINQYIIAADVIEEAKEFFIHEIGEKIGGPLPADIEEVDWLREVPCGDGKTSTVKDIVNAEMDLRNTWLRLSIPCDLHWPFVVTKLD